MLVNKKDNNIILWIPLILGVVLALGFLEYVRTHILVRLDEVALGTETTSVISHESVDAIHCMDATDHSSCVETYKKTDDIPTIVWLGNSQLHAINRYKQGQKNAPALLHAILLERGRFLTTYSQPNANIYEHAVVFNGIYDEYQPKLLVLALCFDDFREFSVRENIASFVKNTAVNKRITQTQYWGLLKPMLVDIEYGVDPAIKNENLPSTTVPLQNKVETWLTNELSDHSLLWESRPGLRGTAASAIHKLRNKILGIHSYSKRHVDQGIYKERMHFLDLFLADVRKQDTDVLVYIPPYRDDIEGPYVESEYRSFKKDVENLVGIHKGHYADIEKVVPGPEWGMVTDYIFGFEEYDFMHFTASGHQKLSNAVDKILKEMNY